MISVSPDDFAPSPELAQALRRDARDGRPIYELVVPRRPIVDDLAAVPMDATFVATRGTARHLERIATVDPLQALWASPASAELFRVCAQAPALRALYVCHFKRLNLASSSFCDLRFSRPPIAPSRGAGGSCWHFSAARQ